MEPKPVQIDLIDLAIILLGIGAVAATHPLIVLLILPLWLIQHYGRRAKAFEELVDKTVEQRPETQKLRSLIIPPLEKPTPAEILPVDKEPFWKGVVGSNDILSSIPKSIPLATLPYTHDLNVPIGYGVTKEGKRQWIYADFAANVTHALVAGITKSGKDTLIKLWFYCLVMQNPSYKVKFVILDGKGEWLIPAITNSTYMFTKPAGGINLVRRTQNGKTVWIDQANEDIENAIGEVFEEISRRDTAFRAAGVANIDRYREKTGIPMPRIIIFALDMGTNAKQLELLFTTLTSKGRSLGITIIISMQTTANQSTAWRNNLGLVLSGNLQLESQDQPVMGIAPKDMFYRPSSLPSPNERPGIFSGRLADSQFVVQVPYLSDTVFEDFADNLPQKQPINVKGSDSQQLRALLELK